MIAMGMSITSEATSSRHETGNPTGVMPPNSIAVSSTARAIGKKEALRTSRVRLTALFTSARVSARTTHAATRSSPLRRPATTTQFAEAARGRSYASVMATVSASAGSISTTAT